MQFLRKRSFRYFQQGLAISLTFICLLILFQGNTSVANAEEGLNDPLVIVVIDATHLPGQTCTLTYISTFGENSHTELRYTIPCPAGTAWESKTVRRSQALASHEPYIPLPTKLNRTAINQQIGRLKDQEKSLILQRSVVGNGLPFSTPCGGQTTAYQTWGYTALFDVAKANITSRVHFYVLPGKLCNQVSIEWAGIHVNSYQWLQIGYSPGFYDHDQYANGWYGVPNGLYDTVDAAGQDYSHGINNVQPKGYTYETWITDPSGTNFFHWDDIPVN